jgi:hypothetical protein
MKPSEEEWIHPNTCFISKGYTQNEFTAERSSKNCNDRKQVTSFIYSHQHDHAYRLLCPEAGGRPLYAHEKKPREEEYIHPEER